MFADKAFHCDCGYRLRGRTEERQVADVRRHAWEAHGISFSAEEALAVLLRFELEPALRFELEPDAGAAARRAIAEDPTRRKE